MRNLGVLACAFMVLQVLNSGQTEILPTCNFSLGNITFIIYTRDNKHGTVTDKRQTICPETKYVVFSTHGFVSEANTTSMQHLYRTIVTHINDTTVYAVDWSDAACNNGASILDLLSYGSAVHNVPEVGRFVGRYIINLMNKCNLKIKDITLMGHSLGAHVMGFAAKEVNAKTGQTCPRMVAMDPARPSFEGRSCRHRLCKSDTERLIALHTSGLGFRSSLGDLDFYYNNGHTQPGCGINVSCSHSRSVEYLTENFWPDCIFVGVKRNYSSRHTPTIGRCEEGKCAVLDWRPSNDTPTGTYYVTTRREYPFCTNATVLQKLLDAHYREI